MFGPIIPAWVYIVAGLLIFVSGAATGTFVTMRVFANAHEEALVEQKAAIENAKAAEYKRAVADTEKRLAANKEAGTAAAKAKVEVRKIMVPGKCEIPPAGMRALNDPALVGETK